MGQEVFPSLRSYSPRVFAGARDGLLPLVIPAETLSPHPGIAPLISVNRYTPPSA
jgi:hypothetical protein